MARTENPAGRTTAGFAPPTGSADPAPCAAKRLLHPYDTATGTIALGVLLTVALATLLPFISG